MFTSKMSGKHSTKSKKSWWWLNHPFGSSPKLGESKNVLKPPPTIGFHVATRLPKKNYNCHQLPWQLDTN